MGSGVLAGPLIGFLVAGSVVGPLRVLPRQVEIWVGSQMWIVDLVKFSQLLWGLEADGI